MSTKFDIYAFIFIFGERVFQQTIGIPMSKNCANLLVDLFLYSYEANVIQGLRKKNEKKLARSFNFTFRYIDDVLILIIVGLFISLIASNPLSLK